MRALEVAAAFHLPLPPTLACLVEGELPRLSETWSVGAIVGPSGSGKTTLARAALGAVPQPVLPPWPKTQPLIDALSEVARGWPLPELARLLTAVGLGSVPLWLRPYPVLSTGQQQRADLARVLAAAGASPLASEEVSAASGDPCKPNLADDALCAVRVRYNIAAAAAAAPGAPPARADRPQGETAAGVAAPRIPLVVVDEFTSGLDRTVARTLSAALARWLRRQRPPRRLVVVSCHEDFLPWLEPDWTVRCHLDRPAELVRGCLRRPPLRLPVTRVPHALWPHFARHHYLTDALPTAAHCFAAWWPEEAGWRPVALCAVAASLGHQGVRRIARLVTLPEFQGLGIASQLADLVARQYTAAGQRVTLTTGHPAMVLHLMGSPHWRRLRVQKHGSRPHRLAGRPIRSSSGRPVVSFAFVGGERAGAENANLAPPRRATLPFPICDPTAEHPPARPEE
jgi:GNAT superfamily N-acetyltransferase